VRKEKWSRGINFKAMPTMMNITNEAVFNALLPDRPPTSAGPELPLYPELFRRWVELETISAAIDRVDVFLSLS
jgi:hypothetical protein